MGVLPNATAMPIRCCVCGYFSATTAELSHCSRHWMALKGVCPTLLRATHPTISTEDLDAASQAHRALSFFSPFHLMHWILLGKISLYRDWPWQLTPQLWQDYKVKLSLVSRSCPNFLK